MMFSPPAGDTLSTYRSILSQIAKRGKRGITLDQMRLAKTIAEEIERDDPSRDKILAWSKEADIDWHYLPRRRSPGEGQGLFLFQRWNS
jgi:hypothetical protein